MTKFCYPGELTPQEAKEYGYEFIKCKFCHENTLVVQQFVNDVICEGCGNWQSQKKERKEKC